MTETVGHYTIVYKGPLQDGPQALSKIKSTFITELDYSIADVQQFLQSLPAEILHTQDLQKAASVLEALKRAGANVTLLGAAPEIEQAAPLQFTLELEDLLDQEPGTEKPVPVWEINVEDSPSALEAMQELTGIELETREDLDHNTTTQGAEIVETLSEVTNTSPQELVPFELEGLVPANEVQLAPTVESPPAAAQTNFQIPVTFGIELEDSPPTQPLADLANSVTVEKNDPDLERITSHLQEVANATEKTLDWLKLEEEKTTGATEIPESPPAKITRPEVQVPNTIKHPETKEIEPDRAKTKKNDPPQPAQRPAIQEVLDPHVVDPITGEVTDTNSSAKDSKIILILTKLRHLVGALPPSGSEEGSTHSAPRSMTRELGIPLGLGLIFLVIANSIYHWYTFDEQLIRLNPLLISPIKTNSSTDNPESEEKAPSPTRTITGETASELRKITISFQVVGDQLRTVEGTIVQSQPPQLSPIEIVHNKKRSPWAYNLSVPPLRLEPDHNGGFQATGTAPVFIDYDGLKRRTTAQVKINGRIDNKSSTITTEVSVTSGVSPDTRVDILPEAQPDERFKLSFYGLIQKEVAP